MVWKVRHGSVLYLGWRLRSRSSSAPWANWHFPPYLQAPLSAKVRHSSVLYRDEEDEEEEEEELWEETVGDSSAGWPQWLLGLFSPTEGQRGPPDPPSTRLSERSAQKDILFQRDGGGQGCSICCPQWPEVRAAQSLESTARPVPDRLRGQGGSAFLYPMGITDRRDFGGSRRSRLRNFYQNTEKGDEKKGKLAVK